MKYLRKILLCTLMLAGVQFASTGCVGYVGGGGVYGESVWYHDDAWVDGGHNGYRGNDRGSYVHPHSSWHH